MWEELSFYDDCRSEAEDELYLEISESANRYYNPDLVEE